MNSKLRERRSKLLKDSGKFEESLNEEFDDFTNKASSFAGRALLIGGSALLSYFIVRAIVGGKKKDESDNEDVKEKIIIKSTPQSIFFKSLSDKAALVLLELAREMVYNIIKNLPEKNDKGDL